MSEGGRTEQQQGPAEAPSDETGQFISAVLGSTEDVWTEILAQHGETYKLPTPVMFSGATQSGCGFAQAAMGSFYCPDDQKIYLDTSFFQDLERRSARLRSKTCQFAQVYVIAHEFGHHLQNQLGLPPQVQQKYRCNGSGRGE
jgi:predicted metalloprotease